MKNFSSQSLDFLVENRFRDSREWFRENRHIYEEHVVEPMKELVIALAPFMHSIDDQLICIPRIGGSISRIYRDARYAKGKSIFREAVWCSFIRDKKVFHGLPGFYFEVSPAGFSYGCGYYVADSLSMASIRELILANNPKAKAALEAYDMQDIFALEDNLYKRSKHPDQPQKLKAWLDQKSLCLNADSKDFALLYSDGLVDKLIEDFKKIIPVYEFFMFAEGRK